MAVVISLTVFLQHSPAKGFATVAMLAALCCSEARQNRAVLRQARFAVEPRQHSAEQRHLYAIEWLLGMAPLLQRSHGWLSAIDRVGCSADEALKIE
jgi:hypothetical protein